MKQRTAMRLRLAVMLVLWGLCGFIAGVAYGEFDSGPRHIDMRGYTFHIRVEETPNPTRIGWLR